MKGAGVSTSEIHRERSWRKVSLAESGLMLMRGQASKEVVQLG